MDFFDFIWNVGQERQLDELRGQLDRARLKQDEATLELPKLKELVEENLEMKLRLSLLVRLLVTKGLINAEEYAAMIAQAHSQTPKSAP